MTFIHALSTAVPSAVLTTERAGALLAHTTTDPRMVRRIQRLLPHTGIRRRHLAVMETQASLDDAAGLYRSAEHQPHGPGMDARSQAFEAASERLVGRVLAPLAGEELHRLAGLITVSCTHASSPGLERAVFANSGVDHGVGRWNLGFMGCSAALAALRLSRAGAGAGRMLAVMCELSSLHFQYSADLEQLTANLLFADGAAAVLTDAAPSPVRVLSAACAALPAQADQMRWWAGDHGLRLALSPELPATLGKSLPGAVSGFLRGAGLDVSAVDAWLVHPGGPQILDVVEAALRLPVDALALSRSVLREYGNMSSPTILFILRAAIEAGVTGRVVLLAFGPGLTIEMALIEIGDSAGRVLRGDDLAV